MWWTLLMATALAQNTCEKVGLSTIADVPAPAVIVLGERPGAWPDLLRVEKLVHKLRRDEQVSLAFQAVNRDKQSVLDQFEDAKLRQTDLPSLLDWAAHWTMPFDHYQPLIAMAELDVQLIAAGSDVELRPADARVPLPPGYIHILMDAVGENPLPVQTESTFVQTMAWRDYNIANTAIQQWNGEGYLIILADRLHVEGNKGVQWQAARLTEHPVQAVLLADGNSPCYAGDRIWREHMLDR